MPPRLWRLIQLKSLSIIVPTPDGGELPFLAQSLVGQLRELDEVIVVGDTHAGPVPEWVALAVEAEPQWRYVEYDAGYMGWGHPQINYGMTQAKGDYLVFQDDDDIFAPDALTHIHRAIRHLDPPRPLLFRFKARRYGGMAIWQKRGVLEVGTIGGHCIVTPNDPERLGKWSDRYEGDFDFIVETLAKYDLEPVWRPEVITFAR